MIKTPNKVDLERTYLSIKRAMYDKPTINIILNDKKKKKMSASPLRNKTKMFTLATFIQCSIGSPTNRN